MDLQKELRVIKKTHEPSYARGLVRLAKSANPQNDDYPQLISAAKTIRDPYYSAFALSGIAKVMYSTHTPQYKAVLDEACKLSAKVAQEWRRAEILKKLIIDSALCGISDFSAHIAVINSLAEGPAKQGVLHTLMKKTDNKGITKLRQKATFSAEEKEEQQHEVLAKFGGPYKHKNTLTLGLFNTYNQNLSAAHIRVVARAAPLCYAYGLNLCLFNFPINSKEEILKKVAVDTNIGEGGLYLCKLIDENKFDISKHVSEKFGSLVATTPRSDPKKVIRKTSEKLCFLLGIGKKGLPEYVLSSAKYHLEFSGQGIPFETSTAMGILAFIMKDL